MLTVSSSFWKTKLIGTIRWPRVGARPAVALLALASFVGLARFGDRFRATWTQEGAVGSVLVPRFAVQSLVENSVKHNARRREPLHVHIDVRRQGDDVAVSVADDGVGFSEGPVPLGRGLGRLEETLRLLHGPIGSLKREVNEGGGARVRWIVPYTAP